MGIASVNTNTRSTISKQANNNLINSKEFLNKTDQEFSPSAKKVRIYEDNNYQTPQRNLKDLYRDDKYN